MALLKLFLNACARLNQNVFNGSGRLFRRREKLAPSQKFGRRLRAIFTSGKLDQTEWDELEAILLGADVGTSATRAILADMRDRMSRKDEPVEALRQTLLAALACEQSRNIEVRKHPDGTPRVLLIVGVNGAGKTTSVGKIAHLAVEEGARVVIAAADTFRAAATEQIETWAKRAGAQIVTGGSGGDPAAIAFDAVKSAKESGADLVLVDTAGRLHTKVDLMNELGKVRRVVEKGAAVDEILLVLDATTGQNGLTQAKVFGEAVALTGVILTKLDGSARGGIIIAIQRELGIPVKFVGLGEGIDDLAPFDAELFVEGILS
ncbi:MAG: signal recognition particle-docking protein FtsY [Actinobacteria bacterium]|nr:MAG: signal recognition particle-docking protein FtsY [Actinomycetota bacterium]